eukprot:Skav210171  [mRNA]  locus=scaffold5148:5225:5863:- [translate_table: standard]
MTQERVGKSVDVQPTARLRTTELMVMPPKMYPVNAGEKPNSRSEIIVVATSIAVVEKDRSKLYRNACM